MTVYPIHTLETAPADSRDQLKGVQAALGIIPNLAAGMAEAPTLLKSFFTVREIYGKGTLTPVDIQALSLVNAMENRCDWCVAFHSAVGLKAGLPEQALKALRAGQAGGVPRLDALTGFSRAMIRKRGSATGEDLENFYSAGFSKAQALEVVLGIAFSTMANYAGHLIHPPLEAAFEGHAWSPR
jgi:AhpD family alkylhydroperoxidase